MVSTDTLLTLSLSLFKLKHVQSDGGFVNFVFFFVIFCVAVQEVRGDRKGGPRQLRQGLWQARCHR